MNIVEFTNTILNMALYPFTALNGPVVMFPCGCLFFCGCFLLFRKMFKTM